MTLNIYQKSKKFNHYIYDRVEGLCEVIQLDIPPLEEISCFSEKHVEYKPSIYHRC